ncbi:NAD(P)-binding protein [Aspergillus granulosus]|uniref:NAD(P)-binding protein n=1 Tax=Aspergillus granulosus TaxID=176169 RepID=A0ABR4I3Q5_9EURO
MPSYLITGASRGLGFEFLRQLSADPTNLVIGLVRNKSVTEEKIVREFGGRNIHLVEGELTDYASLKKAAEDVARITSSLDYLVANAAVISSWSAWEGLGDLGAKDPVRLEADLLESFQANTVGNIHLFNLFLPLIQKGQAKKVITITTGMADIEFIANFDIAIGAPYSISKAAANAAVAKFSAQYRKDGILFLSLSPGLVDTGNNDNPTPEQLEGFTKMAQQFATYAPSWTGPITPKESVEHLLDVIYRADINKGYAGSFLSHYGNKQWL